MVDQSTRVQSRETNSKARLCESSLYKIKELYQHVLPVLKRYTFISEMTTKLARIDAEFETYSSVI